MLLQRMISENCVNQGTVIVLFGPPSYVKTGGEWVIVHPPSS